MDNPLQKYALITGAGSGLGKAAAESLLERGFVVFSCDRVFESNRQDRNAHFIKMDVTCDTSVAAALEYIKSITKRLDVVACFAGVISAGALAETDAVEALSIFNVNVLGVFRVNNAAFDMVKQAKGRYINVSSEYGVLNSAPFYTLYPATKHALEMYNIGLRREMSLFGIRVVCIRPGAYKTDIIGDFTSRYGRAIEKSVLYKDQLTKISRLMNKEFTKAKPASAFLKTFKKAALNKKPKFVYKTNNSLTMKLLNILPIKMQDWLIKRMLF
ncbi:MAG: SDR family NAD(P)-dependent oxidoreductase [Firmicutes bacterium]|nr:SDR family NAD(P)-dependent oxidoreductase [Bacillota bacterium]